MILPAALPAFRGALLIVIAGGLSIVLCLGASNPKALRIRVGLSDSLFGDLNETDARAAVKAWSTSVASTAHVEIEGIPELMRPEGILQAIANHLIDAFSITVPEFAKVARFVDQTVFMDEDAAKIQLEYLILVRQGAGIRDLAGLRGHTLLTFDHAEMCVSPAWIETLLAASNLEPASRFFGRVSKSTKVSQTVLPVFFGRVDACLITRPAFDVMCEMNPQLRQKLQVLLISPKVVPYLIGVHKDLSDDVKRRLHDALIAMSEHAGGRQILTLFQVKRLIPVDTSVLRGSVDLLAAYDRLKVTNRSTAPIR